MCCPQMYSTGSSFLDSEYTHCINGHPIVTHECYRDFGVLMSKHLPGDVTMITCYQKHIKILAYYDESLLK